MRRVPTNSLVRVASFARLPYLSKTNWKLSKIYDVHVFKAAKNFSLFEQFFEWSLETHVMVLRLLLPTMQQQNQRYETLKRLKFLTDSRILCHKFAVVLFFRFLFAGALARHFSYHFINDNNNFAKWQ